MFQGIDGQKYATENEAIEVNRKYWNEMQKVNYYKETIGKTSIYNEEKLNNILDNIIEELRNNLISWQTFKMYYEIFLWFMNYRPYIVGISDLAIGLNLVKVYFYEGSNQQKELENCKNELKKYIYECLHEEELLRK